MHKTERFDKEILLLPLAWLLHDEVGFWDRFSFLADTNKLGTWAAAFKQGGQVLEMQITCQGRATRDLVNLIFHAGIYYVKHHTFDAIYFTLVTLLLRAAVPSWHCAAAASSRFNLFFFVPFVVVDRSS
jgi:hypothetical protein